MASSGNNDSGQDFARAFGNALRTFMSENGTSQVDVVRLLGLTDKKTGKPSKSRLNSYLQDPPTMPNAQVLYLACTRLDSFKFEHDGFRITAETLRPAGPVLKRTSARQLTFRFNRQFDLTDKSGAITEMGVFAVKVSRPPGRIELSVSLKANRSS